MGGGGHQIYFNDLHMIYKNPIIWDILRKSLDVAKVYLNFNPFSKKKLIIIIITLATWKPDNIPMSDYSQKEKEDWKKWKNREEKKNQICYKNKEQKIS